MSVLTVILIAAVLHASWNAFIKNKGNGFAKMTILATIIGIIVAPFTFVVGVPPLETCMYLGVSIIAHTMYMHSLTRAYQNEDFSVAYPFARGLAPLLTVIILLFFFNRSISTNELIGIGIIILGILILFNAQKLKINFKILISLLYFPVSIVFYTLVDAMGVKTADSTQQFIVWLFILIPIPMLLYSLANQKELVVSTFIENKYSLILASIGSLTSYSLVLWAYTQAPIYYVASIRESSIIFASLIGLIFFKEKGLLRRLLASIVLFAGVVILEYSS
ncbi:DMT family transporter [Pelagibacteraceae bacterium]|nr:DMT family transporter [Pelagibacteraceae bacterium]